MSDFESKLPVALHDEDGAAFSLVNPLPVIMSDASGDATPDYDKAVAVAEDASVNHDFSVPSGETWALNRVHFSGSGRMKIEIQIGDGAETEVFATKYVAFNSTAFPSGEVSIEKTILVLGTAETTTIRIIKTNLDKQAQDLYSTMDLVQIS